MIGTTLGHYRIVEKIGAGGMGVVYRANDERLDRDVAIKVLPEDVAEDEERLARFEREAKLLASLSHQNIATLHGLEEHESQRYLVMELAEGETLAHRIDKGPIPIDERTSRRGDERSRRRYMPSEILAYDWFWSTNFLSMNSMAI